MNHFSIRWFIVSLFACFCLWLQMHTFINSNILWLMHVGAKLLAGGQYYSGFIEVNPPMCIYIYLPAVILNHLSPISFIACIIIYLFSLTLISWLFCVYLLNKIFAKTAPYILFVFEFALAFSYFILPAYSFGEREYLLVVLIMPYLLMAVLRLSQRPINSLLSIIAGIMAAVGFAQKPYFIPIWLSTELYLIIRTKSLKLNFRPEGLACIAVYLLYGVSIIFFTPTYITKILPLISYTYYLINRNLLTELIMQPAVYFAGLLIVLALYLRGKSKNQALLDLLVIALLGGVFVYLVQQTLWYYHMVPIFMIGSLLLVLLATEFLPQYNVLKIQLINSYFYQALGLTACFALLIPFLLIVASKSINGSLFYTQLIFKQPVFDILKNARGKPVYIFTNDQIHDYLLIDYSQTITPSKFPSLWLIAAADELAATTNAPQKKRLAVNIADFVRQTEIKAIMHTRPVYIFVQNYEYQISNGQSDFWTNQFVIKRLPIDNHLQFFLADKSFIGFWQNYRYEGQTGNFSVYKLK